MTNNELLEKVAQMLYDKAEIASDAEDNAISEDVQLIYRTESQTYCAAAEYVRSMKEAS